MLRVAFRQFFRRCQQRFLPRRALRRELARFVRANKRYEKTLPHFRKTLCFPSVVCLFKTLSVERNEQKIFLFARFLDVSVKFAGKFVEQKRRAAEINRIISFLAAKTFADAAG